MASQETEIKTKAEDSQKPILPNNSNNAKGTQTDNQLAGNSMTASSRRHGRVKLTAITSIVVIISLAALVLVVKASSLLRDNDSQQSYFPQDTNYPEEISNLERDVTTDEVTNALNKKYGQEAIFEVLDMKKGEYEIGDVSSKQIYFDVSVRISSEDINTDFSVDYVARTDNLWSKIQRLYGDEITADIKEVDPLVESINFNLSDFSGSSGDSNEDFNLLTTTYGRIPARADVEQLIQTLEISTTPILEVVTESEDVRIFIDSKKNNINALYEHISEQFPRIPEGIGATSVTLDFGNDVSVQLLPLSETISISVEGSRSTDIEYDWAEIIEPSL